MNQDIRIRWGSSGNIMAVLFRRSSPLYRMHEEFFEDILPRLDKTPAVGAMAKNGVLFHEDGGWVTVRPR